MSCGMVTARQGPMVGNVPNERYHVGRWVDAGSGVRARIWRLYGSPDSVECTHECTGRRVADQLPLHTQWSDESWHLESAEPLTISTVIHCRDCGLRGFVRGGEWVPE